MDLRGKYPIDTFQYIVTTDGHQLFTGTGSLITSLVVSQITSSVVTQSFATESFVHAIRIDTENLSASAGIYANPDLVIYGSNNDPHLYLVGHPSVGGKTLTFEVSSSSASIGTNAPFLALTNDVYIGSHNILSTNNASTFFGTSSNAVVMGTSNILVTHCDGTSTVYNPSANNNISRGNALMSASLSLVSGDVVRLCANTYDIQDNTIDLSLGGSGSGVCLYGQGQRATIIKGSREILTGPIIQAGTNSDTANLTIIGSGGDSVEQCPWGVGTGPGFPFDNALLRNVYIKNPSDGPMVFFTSQTSSATIVNVTVDSNWDCLNAKTLGGDINVYNCVFSSSATASVNSGLDSIGVNAQSQAKINLFNTQIHIENGSRSIWGVLTNAGTASVHGCVISTHASSAPSLGEYAFKSDGLVGQGIIEVVADTVYDPVKTSGTITHTDSASLVTGIGSTFVQNATFAITASVGPALLSTTAIPMKVVGKVDFNSNWFTTGLTADNNGNLTGSHFLGTASLATTANSASYISYTTSSTPPVNSSSVVAWLNVTVSGSIFKMPLYQ